MSPIAPWASDTRLTPVQLAGLFCWRGGLLLVAGYSLFRGARFFLTYVDLPMQLEVGIGLAAAGAVMVMGSIVAERVRDGDCEPEA